VKVKVKVNTANNLESSQEEEHCPLFKDTQNSAEEDNIDSSSSSSSYLRIRPVKSSGSNKRLTSEDRDHHNSCYMNNSNLSSSSSASSSSSSSSSLAAARRMLDSIQITSRTSNRSSLDEDELHAVPKFATREVELSERALGRGEFCEVFEIKKIMLDNDAFNLHDEFPPQSEKDMEVRNFMHKIYDRNGQKRYAVKKFRPKIHEIGVNRKLDKLIGLLNQETKMLRRLKHPNVIRLRGVHCGSPTKIDYFIVLDRLTCTLQDKIYQKWRADQKSIDKLKGSLANRLSFGRVYKKRGLMEEHDLKMDKLYVMLDLANAIAYLHEKRIIYRDIKPENIGFDIRNDLKLFDLGLARELPPYYQECTNHQFNLYLMTACTGSRRYMAPEVALHKPYGLSADIYGFAILMWEIMCLRRPFAGMKPREHELMVAAKGMRPSLNEELIINGFLNRKNHKLKKLKRKSFNGELEDIDGTKSSLNIVALMARCWDKNPAVRLTMRQVKECLTSSVCTEHSYVGNSEGHQDFLVLSYGSTDDREDFLMQKSDLSRA